MSKKDKFPWYKRIYGFIEDKVTRSFGSFEELSCLEQGKLLRRVFRTPQLKEGTYRAFIWEPGSVIVILLTKDEDSIYVESSEAFTKILIDGEYDFNIGFDHSGGMEAVERMLRCGCEEVIV